MFADQLRKSILQAAIQGKLTEQLPTDGDARDLLKKIRAEKDKLLAEKKIKVEKPLPPISDDEIPFDLPDNWCWCRLGEVCQINPRNKLADENIDVTFLPMTSINNGYNFGYNPLVKAWNEIKNGFTHFADGDVIFAKITPCFQNRKSAIVKNLKSGVGAGTTEIYVLRPYGNLINEKYLLYFVKNQRFIDDGLSTMKGTAGQQRISKAFVENYLFPLPPLAEQKRIVARLEELLAEINELARDEQELTTLEENFPRRLKSSLLQAAVQGKLTEQLPTDGDARDLLKKIRAEKDKLLAEKKIKADKPLPLIIDDEIPFDLPDNWCWCRLGKVCDMSTGNSIAESEKKARYLELVEGLSYIGTKDISFDNQIDYDNGVRIPFESNFRRAKKNSVLMCIEGGSAGRKIAMTNREVCFGNKLCNFYSDKVSNEYIYYYLQSPTFLKSFRDNVTGMIGGVSLKRLNAMLLPIPPSAEQEKIVEKLNELLPLCDELGEKP